MANPKQNAPLPPYLTLTDGMTVRVTAYNQATGAPDAGVIVSGISFTVDQTVPLADVVAPKVGPAYFPGGSSDE